MSESKFFVPIEFPELEKAKEEKKMTEDKFPVDVQTFIAEFARVLRAVESGTSELINKAIDLKKAPVYSALKFFELDPSKNSLRNFLDTVEQDINLKARREMFNILNNGHTKLEEYLKGSGLEK